MTIHQALRYINLMVNMDNQYVPSFLSYPGAKYKLLPQLVPLLDGEKPNFIDPFAGGGSIYSNIAANYDKVWVNDKIKHLIEIHQNLIAYGQDFVEDVKFFCVDKEDQEGYNRLRALYNSELPIALEQHEISAPLPAQLFALLLCCTNHLGRYNAKGKFNQTFGRRTFNESSQKKIDNFLQHIQTYKDKLYFTSLDFEQVIPKDWARTMLYADCPYGSKINGTAGYNTIWNENDERRLFNYIMRAADAGASCALSNVYDADCPENNALVVNLLLASGKFNMVKLTGDYKKVARDKEKKQLTEVVIRNYQ